MKNVAAARFATAFLCLLLPAATLCAQASDTQAEDPTTQVADQPASQVADLSAQSVHMSKVRIVRLSEIKGDVQMDRNMGRGFEPAIANLPIVEKSQLQTQTGAAEVEFEDNSSLRLAPDSLMQFETLERMPGGTTVSSVRLVKGMAYVSLMKTAGNEFNLLFGRQSVRLQPASHVRVQLNNTEAKLAVLDGTVRLEGPAGTMDVARKQTVTMALNGDSSPLEARGIAQNAFDQWDHNSTEYHERFAAMSALNGSPYSYGASDMAYYGAFNDLGGCGMMWQPYFASANWEPYANGSWAWFEGAGYSWVSPYPWGWMPYHYGSWSFCPGSGWGWMPGGNWMGLNNGFIGGTNRPGHIPKQPIRGPRVGERTLLQVNVKPLVRSQIEPRSSSFVFRKDSAGLGVPRNELGKLGKFSEHANARGDARTEVYFQAPQSGRGEPGRGNGGGVISMHRGSAPPAPAAAPSFGGSAGSRGSSSTTTSSSISSPSSHGSSSSGGGSHH